MEVFAGETYKDGKEWDSAFEMSLKRHQVSDVGMQIGDKNGSEQLARSGRGNQQRVIEDGQEYSHCQS